MVVGAYTIINTIGLLVGLPLNLSTTYNHPIIDINHNVDIIEQKQNYSDYYLILDAPNVSKSSFFGSLDSSLFITVNFSTNAADFSFSTSIGDYLIYQYESGNSLVKPYTIDIDFTGLSFGSENLIVNQIYFARLTSSLQPINGDSVIGSITSGLGLMGDITTNFKNGFSALIWNSTENKLTTFGNFVLIFLGVSITFSIIKLCLNLIRSKTGA